MSVLLVAAGVSMLVIGVAHSVLGERLVFSRMRRGGCVPTQGGELLRERHVRILWASWHLVTIFGLFLALVLFWLATPSAGASAVRLLGPATVATIFLGGALVIVGTRGRHPGGPGLVVASLLAAAGLLV